MHIDEGAHKLALVMSNKIQAQLLAILQKLDDLQGKNNAPPPHLDSAGAAKHLGISLRLFQEFRRQGFFRGFKLNSRRLFRVSDLDHELERFREAVL